MTEVTAVQEESAAVRPGIGTRLVDGAVRRLMGVSQRNGRYRVVKGIDVPTRDGARLITDHYIPETEHAGGTILIRGPYGRAFPNSTTYGAVFAGAGYHVLVQSVRGTFGSTGGHQPMVKEAEDGQDTVSWLRSQPWFDKRLATIGGSYLGFAQWALLEEPPPELIAAVIVVGPHDFSRAMHGTGAFALAMGFGWSEAMATQESVGRLKGMMRMFGDDPGTRQAMDGLPLAKAAEPILNGKAPWYSEWLSHEDLNDSFWDPYRHHHALLASQVPTLLVGGWQDIFLEQTIEQYLTLHQRNVEVALTIGPWAHLDTIAKGSGVIWRESLDWLDKHLAGRDDAKRSQPVRLFVTGAKEWRDFPEWPPPAQEQVYYLQEGGALGESGAGGTSTFTFDPSDPTPAVAGPLMHPRQAGVKDNKELEARPDVLTFTGAPLGGNLDVIGGPVVELALSVDNPHADVFVRLCDVDPRGTSRNITDAFIRLDPAIPANQVHHLKLALNPCAHRLQSGNRLRLQVSGGAHPRFARNLGTDEPPTTGQRLVPSVHVVHHDGSRVILPIESASGG